MRIIKSSKDKDKDIVKFECKACGCEFETSDKDEYWTDSLCTLSSYPPKYRAYASCPECHKVVYSAVPGNLTIEDYKVTLNGISSTGKNTNVL